MYALIQDNQIISYGALPDKVYVNDRWYDLRNNDTDLIAEAGFVKIVEVPRPEDTETVIYNNWGVELVEGVPTMVWPPRTLSQEEIDQRAQMALEQANAEARQAMHEATAALMEDAHEDGQPWSQPQGAHNAVPFGRTVTHISKEWRSKHHANVWEPSASSPWWEEVIDVDPGPQPWALDVYYTPPTKVTFEDNTYECTFEHLSQVGWEPSNPTMHSVWKLTTP